ncbi:MAG: type II toxin-antitoxin system VapC family toxin [Chthoniobacteraceae bacterium]
MADRAGGILLDSSVIIAHFRGKLDLFEHVSTAEPLFVPLVALGELLKGALKSDNPTRHRAKIDAFLKIVAVLNPDFETAEHYAQASVALASKGYAIPENDLWIAATALELEMPLATRDAHFQRVEGLEVLAW